MSVTYDLKVHGSGTVTHENGPNLSIRLVCDNFYRSANKHVQMQITSGYLVGGTYSYPIDVLAWLATSIPSATPYSKCRLFGRTAYSNSQINLSQPLTLDAPNPNDSAIYLVIGVMSICTCLTTATTDSIVNSVNITTQFPKIEPYFWRMQYDKNPAVSTGTLGWHLARPFYICKTINGVKGWCSCEDETKLVYDANGNKID